MSSAAWASKPAEMKIICGLNASSSGSQCSVTALRKHLAAAARGQRAVDDVSRHRARVVAGVERVLEARADQHAPVALEDVLGAVAEVHVEIEDGDAVEAVVLERVRGAHRHVVEEAEAHRLRALGVVAGRAHVAERAAHLARRSRGRWRARWRPRPAARPRTCPGTSRCRGRRAPGPRRATVALSCSTCDRGMHPRELLERWRAAPRGAPGSRTAAGRAAAPRWRPRRAGCSGWPVAHVVQTARRVRNEGHGHGDSACGDSGWTSTEYIASMRRVIGASSAGPPVTAKRIAALFKPASLVLVGRQRHPGHRSATSSGATSLTAGSRGRSTTSTRATRRSPGRPRHRSVRDLPEAAGPRGDRDARGDGARDRRRLRRARASGRPSSCRPGSAKAAPPAPRSSASCAQQARQHGLRFLGPNSLGVIRTDIGLNASCGPGHPEQGRLALVSQSGALCAAHPRLGAQRATSASRAVISTGVGSDVRLRRDPRLPGPRPRHRQHHAVPRGRGRRAPLHERAARGGAREAGRGDEGRPARRGAGRHRVPHRLAGRRRRRVRRRDAPRRRAAHPRFLRAVHGGGDAGRRRARARTAARRSSRTPADPARSRRTARRTAGCSLPSSAPIRCAGCARGTAAGRARGQSGLRAPGRRTARSSPRRRASASRTPAVDVLLAILVPHALTDPDAIAAVADRDRARTAASRSSPAGWAARRVEASRGASPAHARAELRAARDRGRRDRRAWALCLEPAAAAAGCRSRSRSPPRRTGRAAQAVHRRGAGRRARLARTRRNRRKCSTRSASRSCAACRRIRRTRPWRGRARWVSRSR